MWVPLDPCHCARFHCHITLRILLFVLSYSHLSLYWNFLFFCSVHQLHVLNSIVVFYTEKILFTLNLVKSGAERPTKTMQKKNWKEAATLHNWVLSWVIYLFKVFVSQIELYVVHVLHNYITTLLQTYYLYTKISADGIQASIENILFWSKNKKDTFI